MRKNIDKWNYYLDLIKKVENNFIEANTEKLPANVFSVNRVGVIDINIEDMYYSNRLYFSGKNPTKKDVEHIKEKYEQSESLHIDNIYVRYNHISGDSCKSSGAIKYTEIKDKFVFDPLIAKEESLKIQEKLEQEKKLIESGYIRCRYCGKLTQPNDIIKSKIIFLNSRIVCGKYKKFVDNKTNEYCSSKCASYDQMAHEG